MKPKRKAKWRPNDARCVFKRELGGDDTLWRKLVDAYELKRAKGELQIAEHDRTEDWLKRQVRWHWRKEE